MRDNLWAIETDSTVNLEPAVFERLLKHMPFMVNSLRLMQLLYTENILEADNSGKRSYKKKTRYTKPNGEVAYDRFVVLRKDKLGIGDEIL